MKKYLKLFGLAAVATCMIGCNKDNRTVIRLFAAASMTESMNEVIKAYEKDHADVKIEANYDSSGTLQKQIEQGAQCDIFLSAAPKQMNALETAGLLKDGTRKNLLENKVALVTPAANPKNITSISGLMDVLKQVIAGTYSGSFMLGLGGEGVPVGQYSSQILQHFGVDESALASHINYGTNVKAVTSAVTQGLVDAGFVYKTDAYSANLEAKDNPARKERWKRGWDKMDEKLTQDQQLTELVEAFKADSGEYKDIETPRDADGRRRLLRSLMNIRLPRRMPPETLQIQDAYLRQRAEEKGIVTPEEIPVREGVISLWQGDITRLAADAIVNAANSQMLGCFVPMHTCIDNCIHTFAGVQLRAECNRQMKQLRARYGPDYEQPTAVPMLTDAYNLPAKKVVHIVGPIVSGQLTPALEQDLADCYSNTLDLCAENGLRSVAFCCISTGVFRFPPERAAQIAVKTVRQWLAEHDGAMERVIFNVFSDKDRNIYEHLFQ